MLRSIRYIQPLKSSGIQLSHFNFNNNSQRYLAVNLKTTSVLFPSSSSMGTTITSRRIINGNNNNNNNNSIIVRPHSSVALHAHISKSNTNNETSNWGWKKFAAYSGILGIGTFCYRQLRFKDKSSSLIVPAASIIEIPCPEEAFVHPYENESWLFKAFLTTKRFLFLSMIFIPCAAVGIVAQITNDEKWRNYWLNMLVEAFDKAGCGFQKFGQWMSMRPDMFSPDVIEAMSRLQQTVAPHSFEHTKEMIHESFGHEINEIFESFDQEPIASGTIAQVHRARLRPEYANGVQSRDVAVKVRHPAVLDETFVDLDFIFNLMNYSKIFIVPFSQQHFVESLQKQINLEWEAYSLSKFATNFRQEMKKGELNFPIIVPNLFSPSILVESWANGGSVKEFFTEVGDGFKEIAKNTQAFGDQIGEKIQNQRKDIAENLFAMCMKMFLRDNYMHGDLHAGNVFYNEKSQSLTILDAGHTSSISEANVANFGEFLHGVCSGNADELVDSILRMNDGDQSKLNKEQFEKDIHNAVNKWIREDGLGHDGRPVCVGDLTGEILFSLRKNAVSLPGDVAVSLVSIAISEGLIRQLDPDFDMNLKALPYLARYGAFGSIKKRSQKLSLA